MGLGAGFKLMDHHKDKEKDNKDKDKEKDKENLKGKEKEDAKGKEKDDARAQALEPSANYGWTAMIEEWLCSSTCSGVLPTPSPSSNVDSPTHVLALPHNALSSGDPRRNGAGKDQRKHKGCQLHILWRVWTASLIMRRSVSNARQGEVDGYLLGAVRSPRHTPARQR